MIQVWYILNHNGIDKVNMVVANDKASAMSIINKLTNSNIKSIKLRDQYGYWSCIKKGGF